MSATRIDDLVAAIEYPVGALGSGSPKRRKKSSKIRMPLIWPCHLVVSSVDVRESIPYCTYCVITEEKATNGGNDSKGKSFNATFGAIDANGTGRKSATHA